MVMDSKDQVIPVTVRVTSPVGWAAIFGAVYLAVLPMSGTIALRNVALLGLLLLLAWQFPRIKADVRLGWPFMLWATYLLLFPLIAEDHQGAWQSFSGQWGRSLLSMLAGAGLAALLQRSGWGTAFQLGLISTIPVFVHLVLVAWKSLEAGGIPWGYWGRETHHADLGYAAGQAVILLAASIVAGAKRWRLLAVALIAAALFSTAVARSRAGLMFAILGCLLVFLPAYLKQGSHRFRNVLGLLVVLGLVAGGILLLALKDDPRWGNMVDKLSAGFLGSALNIQCEGTASVEPLIRSMQDEQVVADEIIAAVRDGDGARMVALRAGLQLSLKHPWGSDGSRQAYRLLLEQECANPAALIVHAHNGWIDTLLAIGWLGALLYLVLLMAFLKRGLSHRHDDQGDRVWGLVLVALSLFWILRGLTDSVYRDHMLEMQGFVLAFAVTALSISAWGRAGAQP